MGGSVCPCGPVDWFTSAATCAAVAAYTIVGLVYTTPAHVKFTTELPDVPTHASVSVAYAFAAPAPAASAPGFLTVGLIERPVEVSSARVATDGM